MRTRTLTITTVRYYKCFILLVLACCIGLVFYTQLQSDNLIFATGFLLLYGYNFYRIEKNLKLLKEVSYDERSIYVKEDDFEIEIPMYRIAEVRLISIDGIYQFRLEDSDQFGRFVSCKPSVWYPFTHKRVDEELRELRKRIDNVKAEYWEARQSEADNLLPGMSI